MGATPETSTGVATAAADPLDPSEIQGNLVGFNKPHVRLVFVGFPDATSAKRLLAAVGPSLSTARDVRSFNAAYKSTRSHDADPGTVKSTWVNLVLSFSGLTTLGAPNLQSMPPEFTAAMSAQAQQLGDVDTSAPQDWLSPFAAGEPSVDAMFILAADDPADLETATGTLQQRIASAGVTSLGEQDGNLRPPPNTGHEHFGFKDGISQPGIAGLTISSKAGTDLIPAGEFLIGYVNQDGVISGQAVDEQPIPEGQPGYPGTTSAQPALPSWTHNGSFVVYRRLQQDVAAFNAAVGNETSQLAAKLVGRWPSGAPMEPVPATPTGSDPAATDPSQATPAVLDDDQINNFDYDPGDDDGHNVPRAAHVRKVNPRGTLPTPGKAESNRHRMLRRGIPYGSEFAPGEPPYGSGPVDPSQDRGLLFIAYQASIARGFEFVQAQWVNQANFPQSGDGQDPIISQSTPERPFTAPPSSPQSFARWVFTTGGGYFFSPSLTAVRQLSK